MTASILRASGTSDGASFSSGDDGTLVIQTGPNGAKVNALTFDATGNPTWLRSAGSLKLQSVLQPTTSGTLLDFTGIPSWAKRFTLLYFGHSTNGSSNMIVRLGTSGGIESAGYSSACRGFLELTSFVVIDGPAAASLASGAQTFTLADPTTNLWVTGGVISLNNGGASGGAYHNAGHKTLAGVLDRVRVTTANGTDVFDAGAISLMVEG